MSENKKENIPGRKSEGNIENKTASTHRLAYAAMLVALAMIFSYIEMLLPISIGVPGIKIGLANLVVLMGLYFLNKGEVLLISVVRILAMGFLFGNMSTLLYSLTGGILSYCVMLFMKKIPGFSMTGVSIAGAVSHNLGQILIAALVVHTWKLFYYLPVLVLSGCLAGVIVGILGKQLARIMRRM